MSGVKETKSVANAKAAWGDDLPDWVLCLAKACENSSQRKVSDQLGKSTAMVSQVLNRRYTGDYEAIEQAVRANLMDGQVECPAFGQPLSLTDCMSNQNHARAGNRLSSFRAGMARHCMACPNSRIGDK